jgi:hypothetical protein
MVNIFVLYISGIDDLTIQDLPIQVLTIHEHLCSQHSCHFNTILIRNMLDASLHDLGNTRLVLANQLSHLLMVDVSVHDLCDTRS